MKINTNINALNAQRIGVMNNKNLGESLEKLSSGLKINKAADNSSGMAIADSLRAQAHSLGQAINNANDAIGIIQTADKAMDEQVKILDTVKTKATQAAQDGQSTQSRKFIQGDISRLLEELDNIASTTSYNGLKLLSGQFNNKEFQIGANSNETIKASIGPTGSNKIGSIRLETGSMMKKDGVISLEFKGIDGNKTLKLQPVTISTSSGTGLGALVDLINTTSQQSGVRAKGIVESTGARSVQAGDVKGLTINGYIVGDVLDVKVGDADGRLVNAINDYSDRTGAKAFIDAKGRLHVRTDGRGLEMNTTGANEIKSRDTIKNGDVLNMNINGVDLGNARGVKENDTNGKLVEHINSFSSRTGVTARTVEGHLVLEANKVSPIVITSDSGNVQDLLKINTGVVKNLQINGVSIGTITTKTNDSDGALVNAINARSNETNVVAKIDDIGRVRIGMRSNKAIKIETTQGKVMNGMVVGNDIIEGLRINGEFLGNVSTIAGDKDNALINKINNQTKKTGVSASLVNGTLKLEQADIDITNKVKVDSHQDKLKPGKHVLNGDYQNMRINGVKIDNVMNVTDSDSDNRLQNAINMKSDFTGVTAYKEDGNLLFRNNKKFDFLFGNDIPGVGYRNGRSEIRVNADSGPIKNNESFASLTSDDKNFGRLSLVRMGASDILVGGGAGFSASVAQTTVNLRDTLGDMNKDIASAAGVNSNEVLAGDTKDGMGVGVSSLNGAMIVMDVADEAIKNLDSVRANLGSSQQQLNSTINNISVTEVNLKAGEAQIRDLDFAKESSSFTKNKILSQSGNYALSQANAVQNQVMSLLK